MKFGLSNPPAVLLMCDSLGVGGTERQFARIAQALDRSRFRLEVACLRKEGAFLSELGEVTEFNHGGKLFGVRSWPTRARLLRYMRSRQIRIAHSFDWYSNVALIPVARLAGVRGVIGSQRSLGDWFSPAHRQAQILAFRLCDRIVCNSDAAAGQLAGCGVAGRKLVVIPNGLPPSAFDTVAPAIQRTPGLLRVGLLARMNNPVKQHPLFLRAAARVLARYPGVEFYLVGDGHLRPQLELRSRELGIEEHVRFLGERVDVAAILASLDFTVLCSDSESLSNSILESMAAGVPVVATRVGGNPELVEHERTGLLTPAGDETALAEAMERMLRRPEERRAWGELGRRSARERFNVEKMQARYGDLYAALLAEKTPRAGIFRGTTESVPGSTTEPRPQGVESTAAQPRPSPPGTFEGAGEQSLTSSAQPWPYEAACVVVAPRPAPRLIIVAPSSRMVGGQAAQAKLLVDGWSKDGRVQAELVPVDTPFPRVLAWCERIPVLRTVIRTPFYLASVWRAMGRCDVAHVFSASYWSFLLAPAPAWLIARLRGVPALINYRSGEARDHLRRSWVAVPILRRCDALVTPSNYLKDVFAEFGLAPRVISNLVDLDQFQFRRRDSMRPALVCTRGFGAYYRVDLVLRAFHRIQQAYPGASLALAGDGPLEASLHKLVSELALHDVTFCGRVSRADMPRLYEQADIFINASEVDNMPVSVLEAFASGTPVVTTAAGGIPYIVEHERTGLLSPPGDWLELAANVVRLLQDPELASRLSANARAETRRYSWECVSDQWLRLYRELAQRGVGAIDQSPTGSVDTGTFEGAAEQGVTSSAQRRPYEPAPR